MISVRLSSSDISSQDQDTPLRKSVSGKQTLISGDLQRLKRLSKSSH
jgi:hypothetical protein